MKLCLLMKEFQLIDNNSGGKTIVRLVYEAVVFQTYLIPKILVLMVVIMLTQFQVTGWM